MLCPCGLEKSFKDCCNKIINGEDKAHSPEQLMRSRYAAYATGNAKYIYHTYSKISQKPHSIGDIQQWAQQTRWLKLVIHKVSPFKEKQNIEELAQVEFSAFYLHQGEINHMRECSNFVFEENEWRYHDGEISINDIVKKPKRNEACFCLSGKKFKQCCLSSF